MKDYNGLVTELDSMYFPQVKYYRDNESTQKMHYTCELFNNGCATLTKTAKTIAKLTKSTEENIKQIILKYYSL